MAANSTLTRDELIARINKHFTDAARDIDAGYQPVTSEPDLEIGQQQALTEELIARLQTGCELNSYSPNIKQAAASLLGVEIGQLQECPSASVADACEAAARAEIELLRLHAFRLTERLLPYVPADQLFHSRVPADPLGSQTLPHPGPAKRGPSLAAVVTHHLDAGKSKWTPKTLAGKTRMLGYLIEHIGPDTPIDAIGPEDIRSFKGAIGRLRSNHRATPAQSFADKQTPNEQLRIAPETVSNIYNPTRAFFSWATEVEGYLAVNPAANIRIEKPKQPKGVRSRRPFSEAELRTLFSAPIFTGCKSPRFRFVPGAEVFKDDFYWIPILGFYTGARLGELVQLHVKDVVLDHEFPHLQFTEAVDECATTQENKHLKSSAAVRKVPLHPDIIELGFSDFVRQRAKRKKSLRLFHRIPFGADCQSARKRGPGSACNRGPGI